MVNNLIVRAKKPPRRFKAQGSHQSHTETLSFICTGNLISMTAGFSIFLFILAAGKLESRQQLSILLCTVYLERRWDCLSNFFNYDFNCFDVRSNSTES